jgi:uncharacterized protein involved in exopolysaccharide biosynthesis
MSTSDNIDLKDILSFIFSKKLLILGFAVVVALATFIYGMNTTPYYEQSFSIYSTLLTSKEIGPFLNSFEEVVNTPSKYLNEEDQYLSDEATKALSKISFGSLSFDQGFFSSSVKLVTYDPSYTEEVVQGLVQYLNDNPYLQKRFDLKEEELKYLIAESESEIEELKVFKQRSFDDKASNARVVNYPINLNSELLLLQESYASYKQQLELLELIQVLDFPVTPSEPSGPNATQNTILTFIGACLFGVFLSFAYKLFF